MYTIKTGYMENGTKYMTDVFWKIATQGNV